ncbi:MAG: hypothetical protein CMO80_15910, partial [Verrucomicrobiales bacterium]|nr:hypothetical protein [Verrucomicrobiales bacterium]
MMRMIFSVKGTRLATAILLAFGTVAKAQEEVVIDLRTREARLASAEALRQIAIGEKQAAEAVARQNNWPIRGTTIDGGVFELVRLENGHPIYYTTHNVNAAISTGVDLIRNISPYNVNGAGILVGVWDGGSVLSTHQEVTGRVNIGDGSASHWHATHVGGTIGASGVNSDALGMAPSVSISSWDWTSDTSEMTGIAASSPGQVSRIYLSNHSYGSINGWSTGNWSGNQGPHYWGASGEREDNKFGRYNSGAASWDSLAFSSQYYLIFKSAGNDRNDAAPAAGATYYFLNGGWQTATYNAATGPFNDGFDNGGFDTISTEGVAKNIMTIGAANDAVAGGLRSVAAGTMSSFSGWGPADDGRIKPDIVANGVGLTSAHDSSNTAYSGSSGTSMSSPNACGSALLLTEYYSDLFSNGAMRASTLKGLIIHTADDVGNAGPDYSYGWGYMNAKTAADHIKRHSDFPTAFFMVESILNSGTPTETYQLRWNGV